jgi:hypothetical protein
VPQTIIITPIAQIWHETADGSNGGKEVGERIELESVTIDLPWALALQVGERIELESVTIDLP